MVMTEQVPENSRVQGTYLWRQQNVTNGIVDWWTDNTTKPRTFAKASGLALRTAFCRAVGIAVTQLKWFENRLPLVAESGSVSLGSGLNQLPWKHENHVSRTVLLYIAGVLNIGWEPAVAGLTGVDGRLVPLEHDSIR